MGIIAPLQAFVLEIAGKQLSGRLRKDLDDVSKKAGISLFSAWRQFDNVKRIFKLVEDQPGARNERTGGGRREDSG